MDTSEFHQLEIKVVSLEAKVDQQNAVLRRIEANQAKLIQSHGQIKTTITKYQFAGALLLSGGSIIFALTAFFLVEWERLQRIFNGTH